MALLIQAECDGCRCVPDNPAVQCHKGRWQGALVRNRVKTEMGWRCVRRKDGWRFYCPECQEYQKKQKAQS